MMVCVGLHRSSQLAGPCVRACVRACVCACVRACVRACVCVCVLVCARAPSAALCRVLQVREDITEADIALLDAPGVDRVA